MDRCKINSIRCKIYASDHLQDRANLTKSCSRSAFWFELCGKCARRCWEGGGTLGEAHVAAFFVAPWCRTPEMGCARLFMAGRLRVFWHRSSCLQKPAQRRSADR